MDLSRLLINPQQKEIFVSFYYEKSLTPPRLGKLTSFTVVCFDFPHLFRVQKFQDFFTNVGSYYTDLVYYLLKFKS